MGQLVAFFGRQQRERDDASDPARVPADVIAIGEANTQRRKVGRKYGRRRSKRIRGYRI